MDNANKPAKVIHMAPLGTGGISKLTITIHKLLDREKVNFDYLVFRDEKEFFEDEMLSLGGQKKIVDVSNVKNKVFKCVKKVLLMKRLFKNEKYDVVHVDASTPYDVIVALAAKMAGIKTIIMHSHNNDFESEIPLRDMFMNVYKQLMFFCVTDYFAISESAAEFMFPKKIVRNKQYKLIRNAINTDDYLYDEQDRLRYRKEMGIDNKLVIGNIGRFVYQKNHDFIIEVFSKIHAQNPESVLLLVGIGALMDDIKKKVESLGLTDNVIFFGATHDVRKVLLAMDVFIFPSRFEGLGIVAVEAQTSGLTVAAADTIVHEVDITEKFKRIHGWDSDVWADCICSFDITNRTDCKEQVVKAGYDIKQVAEFMQEFYLNKQQERTQ